METMRGNSTHGPVPMETMRYDAKRAVPAGSSAPRFDVAQEPVCRLDVMLG